MADEIGVGLIGDGVAARAFHAPVIRSVPALRLRRVVARRADEARARYPEAEVTPDAEPLLRDEGVELVVVATPNDSHFDLARGALLAGKHVVVEKPLANTFAEARLLAELARAQGRLLSAHHNRRWDGDFLTVRGLLGAGLLGRLVEYESHFGRFRNELRPGAWRESAGEGGGILFDLGPHLIDQALVLFGPPVMITADARVQRDGATAVDNFELILHYENLKVTLKAGMLVRGRSPRFILRGTEGSFVKYGLDPQEEALKLGRSPSEPGWGREPEERWGTLDTQVGGLHLVARVETLAGSYQSFYQNIADALRGRAEPAVSPEEASAAVRIVELAAQSSVERRTLPFSP